MAELLAVTWDTQPNGTAITSSNTPFTTVWGTGTRTFSTDQAVTGTRSAKIVCSSQTVGFDYNFGATKTAVWYVFYVYFTGAYTAALCNFWGGSTLTLIGDIRRNTDGRLSIRDNSSQQATTTNPLADNTWHRIAVRCEPGLASNGFILRTYEGSARNGATPTQTASAKSNGAGITDVREARIGMFQNNTSTIYLDEFHLDDATEWAPVVGAQTLLPASDITTTGWTAYGSGASFAARLADADDATYVESPSNPSSSPVEVKLGSGVDPGTNLGHSFTVRAQAPNSATSTVACALYQGATLIHSQSFSNVSASSWTDLSVNVPEASAANITDYTDLRVRVTATAA